jgi:cysteine synthase
MFYFIIFILFNSYYGLHLHNSIGNTPLVRLSNKINPYNNIDIYVKLEYYNPSGSIKDRMVEYILNTEIKNGKITKNTTIIEASSGNTGSSIALLSNLYGLNAIISTNKKCSDEKINFMKLMDHLTLIIFCLISVILL